MKVTFLEFFERFLKQSGNAQRIYGLCVCLQEGGKDVRKALLVLLALFLLVALSSGCKDDEDSSTTGAPEVKGEPFEGEWVNLLVPEGWQIGDFPETRQINMQKTGTQMYVLLKLERDSVRTAEGQIDKFVEDYQSYKSTPTEAVTYGTNEFFKTTYELGGPQTLLKTDIGTWDTGTASVGHWRATVTLQGRGHDTDEGVEAIMNSLVFKVPE